MTKSRTISLRSAPYSVALGIAVWAIAPGTIWTQQNPARPGTVIESGRLRHAQLRGVTSSRIFDAVNRNDVQTALKLWYDDIGQRRGYILNSTVDIVDSVAQIRQRLQEHSVEVVTMGAVDYFELESTNLVVPALTDARTPQGGSQYSYSLIVNPASGITSLAGLRGRNLLIAARGSGETGTAWVEVLLGKEKLGRASAFFASIKPTAKPQSCILQVFFGTTDACVVDEINMSLAREMNPQLGTLKELARSRPMIESVIAVPAQPPSYRQELIDSMLTLHRDSRGKQMLMVFKTERIVRIQPGDLDSARELWRDYYRITGVRNVTTPALSDRTLTGGGEERY